MLQPKDHTSVLEVGIWKSSIVSNSGAVQLITSSSNGDQELIDSVISLSNLETSTSVTKARPRESTKMLLCHENINVCVLRLRKTLHSIDFRESLR